MKRVSAPCWETSDGKLFTDRTLAEAHQFRLDIGALVTELHWGSGGDWSASMLVDSLVENRNKFELVFFKNSAGTSL